MKPEMLHSSFIISRYWPNMGGSELHTRRLAHEIANRVDVDVISHCTVEKTLPELAYASNTKKTLIDNGVPYKQLVATGFPRELLKGLSACYEKTRLVRPVYSWLMRHSLKKTLYQYTRQRDLLHNIYNGSTATTQAVIKIARKQDVPFVLTPLVHTTLPEGTAWSCRQFIKLYNAADAILTMTEYEKQWLMQRGIDEKHIHICPMAPLLQGDPDTKSFRRKYCLNDNPFILFLGRLVNYKGYQLLLEATARIWKHNPDVELVFAGPMSDEAKKIFSNVTDRRIHYIGSIMEQEKTSALAACDFLCVPSFEESLGVTYLEAWQFKKPVIAMDIPVLRTVISDGVDGLLCKPDPRSVADACIKLLESPEAAVSMGLNGFYKVNQNYNWQHIGDKLLSIYQKLLR